MMDARMLEALAERSDFMNDVLAMCSDLPELVLSGREVLIEEGVRSDRLYVLKSGAFEVVRNGVRVVTISEPGRVHGRDFGMLGSASTASVVAARDSTVHVVDSASTAVRERPELTYAIAKLPGPPARRADRLPGRRQAAIRGQQHPSDADGPGARQPDRDAAGRVRARLAAQAMFRLLRRLLSSTPASEIQRAACCAKSISIRAGMSPI
jgi:CRP-like cAMP-binding protein